MSLGFSFGEYYNSKSAGSGLSGFESRSGAGVTIGGSDFRISSGVTNYGGINPQTTGTWGFGIRGFNISYENDDHGFFKDQGINIINGDGGDRYRTAALKASYFDGTNTYSAGFNLFTGDPDSEGPRTNQKIKSSRNGLYFKTYDCEDHQWRMGAVYIGFNNYKFGLNSEIMRNWIQNEQIHDRFGKDANHEPISKHFEVMDTRMRLYFNNSSKNGFSLW